jgi:hypothetical protein
MGEKVLQLLLEGREIKGDVDVDDGPDDSLGLIPYRDPGVPDFLPRL